MTEGKYRDKKKSQKQEEKSEPGNHLPKPGPRFLHQGRDKNNVWNALNLIWVPSTASQPGDSSLSVLAAHNGAWPEGPMAALGVACWQRADLTWHMGKSGRPELRAPQDGAGEQVGGGLSPNSGSDYPDPECP